MKLYKMKYDKLKKGWKDGTIEKPERYEAFAYKALLDDEYSVCLFESFVAHKRGKRGHRFLGTRARLRDARRLGEKIEKLDRKEREKHARQELALGVLVAVEKQAEFCENQCARTPCGSCPFHDVLKVYKEAKQ